MSRATSSEKSEQIDKMDEGIEIYEARVSSSLVSIVGSMSSHVRLAPSSVGFRALLLICTQDQKSQE